VRFLAAVLAVVTGLSAMAPVARAADDFISEYKFGILLHDAGLFGTRKEHGIDGNFEVLFESPGFLGWLGSPRPHLGIEISSAEQTNKAYFGLSWGWTFWGGWFAGFSLGGAAHDGFLSTTQTDRKELGSRFLFRESVELGYVIGGRHTISLLFDHVSNAKLAKNNDGMDSLGLRYGYRF
jgi:lipid A 3-O-deacylase